MAVSILIPVYNYGAFLRRTLESVWSQTFSDFEIVLVDDGSEDDSLEVARQGAVDSPVPMVVLDGGRQGVSGAMNLAMNHSSRPLVAMVHADDVHLPSKIELQVAALLGDERASLVHTEYGCIDEHGAALGVGSRELDLPPAEGFALRSILEMKTEVRSVSMMFRREALDARGGFDPLLPTEDWQAILKLAAEGRVLHIDDELVLRRIHSYNKHTDITKRPTFHISQIAPEVIADVLPAGMDLTALYGKHTSTRVASSIGSGNVAKGWTAFSYGFKHFPPGRLDLVRGLAKGFQSLVWSRGILPLIGVRAANRLRRVRQRRRRVHASSN